MNVLHPLSLYEELRMAAQQNSSDPVSQGSALPSFRSPVAPALNSTLVGNNANSQNDEINGHISSSAMSTSPNPTPANVNVSGVQALQPLFLPTTPWPIDCGSGYAHPERPST